MHSCLYEGTIWHRRRRPTRHAFRHHLFMVFLDLAELPGVFRGRWLWGCEPWRWARFRRADHLGDPATSLDESVRALVERHTGARPSGPVRLLTQLRYGGVAMNPLALYYCYDEPGERVETVVAEVTNTPWGEQHCYVLSPRHDGRRLDAEHAKEFHVSPFMELQQRYRWRLANPGESLRVRITSTDRTPSPLFDAALSLRRRTLSSAGLAWALARYPLLTTRIAAAIYGHALRLWWKGTPFHPHPRHRKSRTPTEEAQA